MRHNSKRTSSLLGLRLSLVHYDLAPYKLLLSCLLRTFVTCSPCQRYQYIVLPVGNWAPVEATGAPVRITEEPLSFPECVAKIRRYFGIYNTFLTSVNI